MIFDEDDLRCAAADCFDADSAGASEDVKEARAGDVGTENIEESFAQTIAGRTESVALERLEDAATVFTGDDAHSFSRPSLNGSGAATLREGRVRCGPGPSFAKACRRWQRLRGELARGVRDREEDWRCGSPGRRIGGCRRIRRGRG